ncbi:MAG TPA: peptidylprolyl isomerase [Saprospiraceae bacterium]|nr:peptidylprolyl isomerase [Saprospiraceae bacterium]
MKSLLKTLPANPFWILAFVLTSTLGFISCGGEEYQYVLIETEYGNMKVKLFNETPQHRDNFVKLVKENYYDDLLFHRVINGFMIQGGDPNSKNAAQVAPLGAGGPGYQIPAEIGEPHFKGALGAARNSNPEKASSGSQFYLVQGRAVDDTMLDGIASQRGITYTEEQRKLYKEHGGTPQLDGEYTVFGEVVEGLDVIDKIAAVQTGQGDRPVQDVKMKIKMAN